MKTVPSSLRRWFLLHFVVDMTFGIPLIFIPVWVMELFEFGSVDTLTVRLVGAALIGIGGASLWANAEKIEVYRSLLQLKILWSGSALVAIALYLFSGGNNWAYLFFAIFFLFSVIWNYYYSIVKS